MIKIIDAKGKPCPMPVVLAKDAIVAGEAHFLVEVDNQIAVENLKRLAAGKGYAAQLLESADGFTVDFTQTDTACAPSDSGSKEYTVLVGRDVLGDGDPILGTNLMRMFFYTLTGADDLPRSIVFLNSGVKLPTTDEQMVEHLKTLTAKGVEVLVCGTCLNFYHLAERLAVGTVSNMYDIVTRLQASAKVISL